MDDSQDILLYPFHTISQCDTTVVPYNRTVVHMGLDKSLIQQLSDILGSITTCSSYYNQFGHTLLAQVVDVRCSPG